MSGWAIGGIFMILYAILVLYTASKKKGIIWKMASMKLGGDRVKDKRKALIMYIFGGAVGIAGVVFLFL